MQRIAIRKSNNTVPANPALKPRGARMYGVPLSKEIAGFLEDVNPSMEKERLICMFFAGKVNGREDSDLIKYGSYDFDDDVLEFEDF